ncbi:hypothetical protein [Lentzea sp. NPDC051838]|uniref:hypothetical protein n=1 Tax=Lentzea sp. NPDC051838 TaxID=3154849 RepID=UPI003425A2D1
MNLLLSDLDRTLTGLHEPLPPDRAAFIESLIDAGVVVAVVTGSSVRDLTTRFGAVIAPRHRGRMLLYANGGGSGFRLDADLHAHYLYDHSAEFAPHRPTVHAAVRSLGTAVTVEDRESQVTVALPGLEHRRPAVVGALSNALPELLVRAAGRKSIDITLPKSTKATAARDVAARLGGTSRVVIAGDAFGDGEADTDLLQREFRGATVFCAGTTYPSAEGFPVVRADTPGPDATFRFLRKHFHTLQGEEHTTCPS